VSSAAESGITMAYGLQPPPQRLNPAAGLKFRQYKSTAAFNFHCLPFAWFIFFQKKGWCQDTFGPVVKHVMLLNVRFVPKMCLIMAQMCLGSNDMCPGFTRHILIRHRADIQKKCSIIFVLAAFKTCCCWFNFWALHCREQCFF
jgi:hypothetical protein